MGKNSENFQKIYKNLIFYIKIRKKIRKFLDLWKNSTSNLIGNL